LQGVVEGKDGELEALRERLAQAKAFATGKDADLTAAEQRLADRRAAAGPTCCSPVFAGGMSSQKRCMQDGSLGSSQSKTDSS